ncbi:hypothetical protein GCM10027577_39690 [Spirosoma fluminis]
MKAYILDTHIFLNAYIKPENNDPRITKILSGNNVRYISAISLIEIAQLIESKPKEIKISIPLAVFIVKALTDSGDSDVDRNLTNEPKSCLSPATRHTSIFVNVWHHSSVLYCYSHPYTHSFTLSPVALTGTPIISRAIQYTR